jgi:hypothetical protein
MERQIPCAEILREAVGMFAQEQVLEPVVHDLMTAGFDHADISVLASEERVRRRLGHGYRDAQAAEDDPDAPRDIWIDPESVVEGRGALTGILAYIGAVVAGGLAFATGGPDAVAIAAGVAGAGALGGVGYGLARRFDGKMADRMGTHVELGGIVLWVKVADEERARRASEVLTRHGAAHVHVH